MQLNTHKSTQIVVATSLKTSTKETYDVATYGLRQNLLIRSSNFVILDHLPLTPNGQLNPYFSLNSSPSMFLIYKSFFEKVIAILAN